MQGIVVWRGVVVLRAWISNCELNLKKTRLYRIFEVVEC